MSVAPSQLSGQPAPNPTTATSSAVATDHAHPGPPAPPATPWPRTTTPLTIVLIGWARLSSQGREGSGYNLSASELARGLVLSGHTVRYLAAGMTNRLGFLKPGKPHIAMREKWGGIDCYELRNSPNVAPAAFNFNNMQTEIAEPHSTGLVLEWLKSVGAQVVHVHSQEGYALDLIPAIEKAGIPVVVTPHNYWFVCPQVDLLERERRVCIDYDEGRRCVGCLPGKDVNKLRTTRAWGQTLEQYLGLYPADVVRKAAYGVKPLVRALKQGRLSRNYAEHPLNPDKLSDPELALGFESVQRDPTRGTTIHQNPPLAKGDFPKDYDRAEWDTNEQVLRGSGQSAVGSGAERWGVTTNGAHTQADSNGEVPARTLVPSGRSIPLPIAHAPLPSPTIYADRRHAGIAALSAASLVTPPSDYLRKVHVSMGVPDERTRWVRLGQPHFDQINRRVRRSPYYDSVPWSASASDRPLRLAFFGTTRPNKGLEVLARAIPLLSQSVRERCHFIVRAQGYEFGFRKRLSVFPEVSVWCGYDLYQLISSVGEYDVGILSHIWLENSPLVLLENFHAGKLVLCSRLGGPVDWIKDPREHPTDYNGLLFTGGAEDQLAQCITKLATGEVAIPTPRQIHQRTTLQSYPAHVHELESIYHEVRARKQGRPTPPAIAAIEPKPAAAPQPATT